MHWYLVHTKPRQEKCALENLERQGFQCYLPTFSAEKLRRGVIVVADEVLFPRYLFIRLGLGVSTQSWAPMALNVNDIGVIRQMLQQLVAGYVPNGEIVDWVYLEQEAEAKVVGSGG